MDFTKKTLDLRDKEGIFVADGDREYKQKNNKEDAGKQNQPKGSLSPSPASSPYFQETGMYRGYIKLWRKTKDWVFTDHPLALALWVHLLLEAKHPAKDGKPLRKIFKGQIIELKDGQILTGRKHLSDATGISESTIEKYLKLFEKEGQITQQKSNKNRLITIVNWELYQGNCDTPTQQTTQQLDNKLHNKKTQYKNIKNIKNYENNNIYNNISTPKKEFESFLKNIKDKWNEMAAKAPAIAQVRAITDERRRKLKQRFSSKDFKGNWEEAIRKISESKFMQGENERKWVVSFDWFINNNTNVIKVVEGRYDDKKKPNWAKYIKEE